jgi:hypothetical protein
MDVGCYNILSLREAFGTEPVECISAGGRIVPYRDQKCDEGFKTTFTFPNGGIGTIDCDNYKKGFLGLPAIKLPKVVVKHKEVPVLDGVVAGQFHGKTRTATFY